MCLVSPEDSNNSRVAEEVFQYTSLVVKKKGVSGG
jgi:hypothetical protein